MESTANDPGVTDSAPSSGEPVAALPAELESLLGHRFRSAALLEQALTHRSLAHELGIDEPQPRDNERLEFLGDAVVGLVAAESLYRRFPDLPEGELTRLRGALVSRRYLAQVAKTLDLGRYLRLGRGEDRSGGRSKAALLANAMEAVLGALYLDGGLDAARRVIETHVVEPSAAALHQQLLAGSVIGDFKSALQELLQARKQGQPEYCTTAESGPDHRKEFFVEVRSAGRILASGTGRNRKLAEQDAARHALDSLREVAE